MLKNNSLPENWIDKIFDCLALFYGDRWTKQFSSPLQIDLYKTMWFNGLVGLSYDQLRHGLAVCKKYSSFSHFKPPNVVRFFQFCVSFSSPNDPRRT